MNVSGVGGAASLPMTLPSSASRPAVTAGAGPTDPAPSQAFAADGRVAGRARGATAEPAEARHQEPPKPAPLPPLRGLTVAEIRAMLGVGPLPRQTEPAAAQPSAPGSIRSAALDRYA